MSNISWHRRLWSEKGVLASEKYWPVHSLSCTCHCWYLGCNQPHEHHCFAWQTWFFFNLNLGVMLEDGCSRFIGPVCETPYRSSVRRDTYFDILLVRKLMLTYQIIINIHWIKQDFFYPSGKIDKLVVGSADVDQSRIFSF